MTSIPERGARFLTSHSKAVIVLLLVVTAVIGAGAPMVDDETELDQFESDSEAAQAATFIEGNLIAEGAENETTVQVIRRGEDGEDVFTRASFIETLELQQEIRDHPEIGPTLATASEPPEGADSRLAAESGQAIIGIGNVLALHKLTRLTDDLDENRTEAVNVTAITATEEFGTLRLADLGIDSSGDLPTENVGNDSDGRYEQFIEDVVDELEPVDDPLELLEYIDEQEGQIRLSAMGIDDIQDIPPGLLGFEDATTLPPKDCMASFAGSQAGGTPPLSCQIWALEEMDQTEFEDAAATVLGPEGELDALALLPQSYEAGSTTASAHAMAITQETQGGSLEGVDGFSESVTEAQLALQELGDQHEEEYLVFGLAVVTDEIDRSLADSTAIVGPIALLFVIVVLTIAYRDLLDILLGVFGILAVLLWTFGLMGWAGISFNQLMIAVPVLLIGLSIDYAIHVFMRHREHRADPGDVRGSMRVALAGVGVALVWVTATAAFGFLSNLISPIQPLRDFGVASAFGIVAALLIFGALVPAAKIEIDAALERRGVDRQKRAFGTGGSALAGLLTVGSRAARRAPVVVVILALLLTAGGVYGAVQVDTSFQEEDFLAEDPPAWTDHLPGAMAPGEYHVSSDIGYMQENFQQVGRQGELLVRGNVSDDEMLTWLDETAQSADEYDAVFVLPNDQPDVRTPLSVMHNTADVNASFNQSFQAASEDGVPTDNVSALYDEMLTLNPLASEVVYRDGGSYEALRIQVGIAGEASPGEAAADVQALATDLEETSDGQANAIATGDPVINNEVEQDLLRTVIESLLLTLVSVFLFLAVAYRLTGNTASLGVVTLLPVLFSVTWILGTMWLIGMPFNALTGTIAALTIGLGIAYSIHISARYELELRRQGDVWEALETTVTGTGGALLGSAATTVLGFGTLGLAILPALRQFGIITALTIIYAFLASVLVLPSLLVLWTRYLGPAEFRPDSGHSAQTTGAGTATSNTQSGMDVRSESTDDETTE